MEDGSPSRHSWADEAQEELPSPRSLGAGSPGALASVFANDLGGHISFSDSEGYSDTEPPSSPPPGKGKTIVEQGGPGLHGCGTALSPTAGSCSSLPVSSFIPGRAPCSRPF